MSESIGDFFARISADTKDFDRKIGNSVKAIADLETNTKKMVGGLASLTTAFGNVGGEAGKALTTVGQLASGFAAGGPLGLAVSGIALLFGHLAEKAEAANKEMEKVRDLLTSFDDAVRDAQLAAMPDQFAAKRLAADDKYYKNREKIEADFNTKISEHMQRARELRDLRESASNAMPKAAYDELLNQYKEEIAIVEQLKEQRDYAISLLAKAHDYTIQAVNNEQEKSKQLEKQKTASKALTEELKRQNAMANAFEKIQKEIAKEEEERRKRREAAIDRMRKRAPEQVSSAYDLKPSITITGTSTSANQSAIDNIESQISRMLGEIVPIFDTFFKGAASKMIGSVSSALAGLATSIGTAIAGVVASPVVLIAVAAAGVAAMWASIPVVIAQFVILAHEIATVWLIPFKIMAGVAVAAVAGFLVLVSQTDAASEALERLKEASSTFVNEGFSPLAEAMFPLVSIVEIVALRMGQLNGSVVSFRNASEAAFNITKDGTLFVVDSFMLLGQTAAWLANGFVDIYNNVILPAIKPFNPAALPLNYVGVLGFGYLELLRNDLENLTFIDAMYGNTDATERNTRAIERMYNIPSGYRLNRGIWSSQQPHSQVMQPMGMQAISSSNIILGGGVI